MANDVRPEWYELRDALERGEFAAAMALLQRDPDLIDARNGIGETVLHFFAVEDNSSAVEWLHSHGADLNAKNTFGVPLLFEVAALEKRDLFLWLVAHGADPQQKAADGQDLGCYLAEHEKPEMITFLRTHDIST